MSTGRRKWLRGKLFKENPYCSCGVKMIDPSELPTDKRGNIKHFPDNTLTLKRKFSRYNGWNRLHNKKPATIMCRKCAQAISDKMQSEVDIEIRRVRSTHIKKLTRY